MADRDRRVPPQGIHSPSAQSDGLEFQHADLSQMQSPVPETPRTDSGNVIQRFLEGWRQMSADVESQVGPVAANYGNPEAIPANAARVLTAPPGTWGGLPAFDPDLTYSNVAEDQGFEGGRATLAELAMAVIEPGPGDMGRILGALPFLRATRRVNPGFAKKLESLAQEAPSTNQAGAQRVIELADDAMPGYRVSTDLRYGDHEQKIRGRSQSGVDFQMTVVDAPGTNGHIHVNWIESPRDVPIGDSFGPLVAFGDLADAAGVTVTTQAGAFSHARLSTDQLYSMYAKFGFEPQVDNGIILIRRPLPLEPNARAVEAQRRIDEVAEMLRMGTYDYEMWKLYGQTPSVDRQAIEREDLIVRLANRHLERGR